MAKPRIDEESVQTKGRRRAFIPVKIYDLRSTEISKGAAANEKSREKIVREEVESREHLLNSVGTSELSLS